MSMRTIQDKAIRGCDIFSGKKKAIEVEARPDLVGEITPGR